MVISTVRKDVSTATVAILIALGTSVSLPAYSGLIIQEITLPDPLAIPAGGFVGLEPVNLFAQVQVKNDWDTDIQITNLNVSLFEDDLLPILDDSLGEVFSPGGPILAPWEVAVLPITIPVPTDLLNDTCEIALCSTSEGRIFEINELEFDIGGTINFSHLDTGMSEKVSLISVPNPQDFAEIFIELEGDSIEGNLTIDNVGNLEYFIQTIVPPQEVEHRPIASGIEFPGPPPAVSVIYDSNVSGNSFEFSSDLTELNLIFSSSPDEIGRELNFEESFVTNAIVSPSTASLTLDFGVPFEEFLISGDIIHEIDQISIYEVIPPFLVPPPPAEPLYEIIIPPRHTLVTSYRIRIPIPEPQFSWNLISLGIIGAGMVLKKKLVSSLKTD